MSSLQSAAIWYTYVLVDPRNGRPFYIGKGTGSRMHAHERQAAAGVCSEKCSKINDIHKAGLRVQKQQLALFWDEWAALEHEREVIAEIGLANLTNMCDGGGVPTNKKRPAALPALRSLRDHVLHTTDGCLAALTFVALGRKLAPNASNWEKAIHGMARTVLNAVRRDAEASSALADRIRQIQLSKVH